MPQMDSARIFYAFPLQNFRVSSGGVRVSNNNNNSYYRHVSTYTHTDVQYIVVFYYVAREEFPRQWLRNTQMRTRLKTYLQVYLCIIILLLYQTISYQV